MGELPEMTNPARVKVPRSAGCSTTAFPTTSEFFGLFLHFLARGSTRRKMQKPWKKPGFSSTVSRFLSPARLPFRHFGACYSQFAVQGQDTAPCAPEQGAGVQGPRASIDGAW
jgi:hypothetical protein